MINLTPYSTEHPIEIDDESYQQLVRRKDQGWSSTASMEECLVKLHYLRQGFREGKIDADSFRQREQALVVHFLRFGNR